MLKAKDLSRDQVDDIIDHIQRVLWCINDGWYSDKEWSSDTIEHVAGALIDAGLRPDDNHDENPPSHSLDYPANQSDGVTVRRAAKAVK